MNENRYEVILKALKRKYEAKADLALVNASNLLTNSVGIADHGNLVSEIEKFIQEVEHAQGMRNTIVKLLELNK